MSMAEKVKNMNVLDMSNSYGAIQFRERTATREGQNPVEIYGSSKADAEAALNEYQNLMRPAQAKALREALVALDQKTKRTKENETDLTLQLKIYLSELQKLPGDIALDVINNWRGTFFPAWGEIYDAIVADPRMTLRRRRIRALMDFITGEPEKPRKPVTPEQIERNWNEWNAGLKAEQNAEKTFWTAERLAQFRERFDRKVGA